MGLAIMMKKTKLRDMIFILLGTAMMAVSINMVYDPMGMVTGGVTGLGIVIKELTRKLISGGVPIWISNLILNIPLFLTALLLKGKRFIGWTLFSTASLTLFLGLIPAYPIFEQDYLLAAVFGGAIGGVGIGLVFASSATTGGTDLLCALIHTKVKHYSVPQLLIVVDGLIVLSGIAVFGINESLYAAIAIYITSKMSDGILEGLKFSKMAYIISDRAEQIAQEIMVRLDRGVTGISSMGMYSRNSKNMLMCVVSKKEISLVLDIIGKTDPDAFVIVSDVREVMGEGFIENIQ